LVTHFAPRVFRCLHCVTHRCLGSLPPSGLPDDLIFFPLPFCHRLSKVRCVTPHPVARVVNSGSRLVRFPWKPTGFRLCFQLDDVCSPSPFLHLSYGPPRPTLSPGTLWFSLPFVPKAFSVLLLGLARSYCLILCFLHPFPPCSPLSIIFPQLKWHFPYSFDFFDLLGLAVLFF